MMSLVYEYSSFKVQAVDAKVRVLVHDEVPRTQAESFVGCIIGLEGDPNTTLGVPEIISTTQ